MEHDFPVVLGEMENLRALQQRDQAEKQRIEAETQRVEAEKLRTETEKLRTETEKLRTETEKLRTEADKERDEAKESTRSTSFIEYLNRYHEEVYSELNTVGKGATITKGTIPEPNGKYCPTNLRPWTDFPDKRDQILDLIKARFPQERRVFENKQFIAKAASDVREVYVISEACLETFLKLSVHNVVNHLIREIATDPELKEIFCLGDDITHGRYISGISGPVSEGGDRDLPNPDGGRKKEPDQTCYCINDKERDDSIPRRLIYVAEYKSPHKLTVDHLRGGLCPMDIPTEIINNATVPTHENEVESKKHTAKKLTARAVSQEYHYMTENGLKYGLLATGRGFVFLMIDWKTPTTLYYHLALPSEEVKENPERAYAFTAVAQSLVLTILAHQSSALTGVDYAAAMQGLRKWVQDEMETSSSSSDEGEFSTKTALGSVPDGTWRSHAKENQEPRSRKRSTRATAQANASQDSVDSDTDEPPLPPRQKKKRRISERSMDETILRSDDDEKDPPGEEQCARATNTPSPTALATTTATTSAPQTTKRTSATRGKTAAQLLQYYVDQFRTYCTQKCLLGLVNGKELDQDCPNVALHAAAHAGAGCNDSRRHPVSHAEWLELLRNQLSQSTEDGVIPLGLEGARGVLFQVTLLQHGYTFVCKGTLEPLIKHLEHEANVYSRIKPIQGLYVPVFLGAIDLRSINQVCYHSIRVPVVHMMCLSWGGRPIPRSISGDDKADAKSMAMASLRAIHEHGVVHQDVRLENMVRNPGAGASSLIVVDFERSRLLDPPHRSLAHLVPTEPEQQCRESSQKRSKVPNFWVDFEGLFGALGY